MLGWVKIHRIAGCISSGSWLLAAASRRHAGHLIQEDCWEVPMQEPWEIRIGGLVVGDGMIYSFLRGQSYWIPIVGWVFDVFSGFKLNKLQCMGIISPRMDEILELVGSVDFESFPPHSHPVSSLRLRLASLFWASCNCWRAFARGTSSWKTCSLSGCWWSCECRKSGKM